MTCVQILIYTCSKLNVFVSHDRSKHLLRTANKQSIDNQLHTKNINPKSPQTNNNNVNLDAETEVFSFKN